MAWSSCASRARWSGETTTPSEVNPGEHYAEKLLQPYRGIFDSEAGTAVFSKAYYDRVTSEKEFHEIEGASQLGLYDILEYISQAVGIVYTFFRKHPDAIE